SDLGRRRPGVRDHRLLALLDRDGKGELARGDGPAARDEGVARPHGLSELAVERGELRRVAAARASDDVTDHVPVRAEAVQDRALLEADAGRELRIGVERVEVAREAVEERLLLRRRLLDLEVGLLVLGDSDARVLFGRRVAAEAAGAAHDDRPRRLEDELL